MLFEFKLDSNIKNIQIRAQTVAQTLYYVRRLKFGSETRLLSKNIAVVTKFSAIIFKTADFKAFYSKNSFDWDLAPSAPCKKLVKALADAQIIIDAHIFNFNDAEDMNNFISQMNSALAAQLSLLDDKKVINEQIYKRFYAEINNLDVRRWKIETWDAVFYQIRMSLGAKLIYI